MNLVVKSLISQLPVHHKILLAVAILASLIISFIPVEQASASHQYKAPLLVGKRYDLSLPVSQHSQSAPPAAEDKQKWQTFKVRKGDNLAKVFKRAGLTPQDTYRVSKIKHAKPLLKMMPGQQLQLRIGQNHQLLELRYPTSATDTLVLAFDAEQQFIASTESKPVEVRLDYAQGEITSNFWNAGVQAGLSDNQIMSLAAIFGWDIDFALGIRAGDHFNVIFEEKYIEGEFAGFGNIIAAEFVNRGDTYQAIRYQDGRYYTADGRSMRKSFLRNPVNFKYISSNFTNRRFHPVQKRWKVHRGVDYAAKTGTPVVAAGDGKVIKSGYNRFNGHYVFIQHGEKYVTKYLHFSKRKVKRGQTVKQGQVIGLVGSTGMASGPHLHYEFLVNGVHHNPRTVKLPQAQPIASKERDKFAKLASLRIEQLNTNKRIMLAKN